MKISTCIPLYNGADSIHESLMSLKDQTRLPDEVIIVDDCSTDNGMEVVYEFADDLPLKMFKNEQNLGMIGNWNACLEKAQGDIITALHQDDGYMPDFLKEVDEDFSNNPSIGMWACVGVMKHAIGNNNAPKLTYRGLLSAKDIIRPIYLWQYTPPPTPTVFKKEALDRVGLYNKDCKYTSEADLYFRIAAGGYEIYQSEKILVWRTTPATRATALHFETPLLFNDWFDFLERWAGHELLMSHTNVDQEAIESVLKESGFVITRLVCKGKLGNAGDIYRTVSQRRAQINGKIPTSKGQFLSYVLKGIGEEMIRQMKVFVGRIRTTFKKRNRNES